jgi:hypothetical protein
MSIFLTCFLAAFFYATFAFPLAAGLLSIYIAYE